MTSLYTRTGDEGETSTFGGQRVVKTHPRVEAYGTVDELNTSIGLAVCAVARGTALAASVGRVQHELFSVGADLATPPGPAATHIVRVPDKWVERLEAEMDAWQASLPPLTTFILPGGSDGAAALHFARAVCRRAERRYIAASSAGEDLNPVVGRYLNRLSDWLFAAARMANEESGVADVIWEPQSGAV